MFKNDYNRIQLVDIFDSQLTKLLLQYQSDFTANLNNLFNKTSTPL